MVANLEDTAMELQRRNDKFDTIFQTYLSQRERHKELIDVFDDDMALLHQVKKKTFCRWQGYSHISYWF